MIKQFFILLYYYLHIVIGTWQLFFSNVDKYGVGLDHTYIKLGRTADMRGLGGRGGYKENWKIGDNFLVLVREVSDGVRGS